MAGTACEESAAGRSLEGLSSVHDSQYGEAMTEWRSSEQVENGMPSTSPPYWDTDDSDDDGGLKPSDLYGKYTWKIEKFSTINKRELKSNVFEIGGYKWYILIYPQGCDVCNHLSLFLCVANHDKLLPGWSHLAQFTIAVVNKDPKKSKYSDTLHRFWKKEHDWGWKKFMELSKVSDGFVDADTLIVKAQVQVVRERADRPFRCLHSQYRREFVRVYLTNVEQICRRFVDDRRDKLGKLLEDKARWSSFCAFWRAIDQSARHVMSREKMDPILKMIVKHFFLEKEVTSTLVMDSLYSGLKALEGQSKCILGKAKALEGEDIAAPVVQLEKDMFILVDDVLSLLERATMDPLPPKDEKGPQNRTKDGGSGEDFYKDSIERDERRLTELGRRTVEIYVLSHIFSKIEAAYQEAVSLKRQEELIREEKAESEQKAKRVIAEKEKRSKKKQGKQKRNNRKAKDKVKDEKLGLGLEDKHIHEYHTEEVKVSLEGQTVVDKDEAPEDASETSDSVEGSTEVLQPDLEDREASPVNWDTDTSVVCLSAEASGSAVGNDLSSFRHEGDNSSSVMDDSSSTCSTDSAPSVVMSGSYRSYSSMNNKSQKSHTRGKNQQTKALYREANGSNGANSLTTDAFRDKAAESIESEAALSSLQVPMKLADQTLAKKEDEVIPVQGKPSSKSQIDSDKQPKEKASVLPHLPQSPPRNKTLTVQRKSEPEKASRDLIPERKVASNSTQQEVNKPASPINMAQTSRISKPDSVSAASHKSTEKHYGQQATLISRPSSTPLIPASKPTVTPPVSMAQMAQAAPFLSRSVSAAGRLGPDSSAAVHSYALQSSRNPIMGNTAAASAASSSAENPLPPPSPSPSFSRPSSLVPGPVFVPRATEKVELKPVNSSISYSAAVARDVSARQQWLESVQREAVGRSLTFDPPSVLNDRYINPGFPETFPSNIPLSTPSLADEFPHLDIINDLLDDEHQGVSLPDPRLSIPADMGAMSGDVGFSPGSCRFERNRSCHQPLFQSDYAFPGHHYETLSLREYIPQSNMMMPYMNEQIEGLVHNQWHVAGHDLLTPGTRNSQAGDGYLYHGTPEYSNLACGLNGYTMFRPSNGH